jgi:hypothetical protein
MSTETVREAETVDTGVAAAPNTGSVWWAELSIGTVCWTAAAVFALSHTAVGPFADLTVVYGTIVATLYCAVAVTLGAVFLHSGFQRTPSPIDA